MESCDSGVVGGAPPFPKGEPQLQDNPSAEPEELS